MGPEFVARGLLWHTSREADTVVIGARGQHTIIQPSKTVDGTFMVARKRLHIQLLSARSLKESSSRKQ